MTKHEGKYAVAISIVILLAYIVPFTLLSNVEKWYGSFLFWTVLTVVVIGLNYLLVKDWGKGK
jgi:cyanate permease